MRVQQELDETKIILVSFCSLLLGSVCRSRWCDGDLERESVIATL